MLYFLRNNPRRAALVLIVVAAIPILIYGSLIFFTSQFWRVFNYPAPFSIKDALLFKVNDCHLLGSGSGAPVAPYFAEIIQNEVIEKKGGRPIEGFEPFMFTEAYPGLQSSDFNCVKAYGGFYIARDDRVIYISTRTNAFSTADHSITTYGTNRLLQNIANRLSSPWPHTETEVDVIINAIGVFPVSITPPVGWYSHYINGGLLLTRQKELPDIGATEGYAYGEQISISLVPLNASPEEWVAQKTYFDLGDVLIRKAEWDTSNGYKLLRVERETPAAPQLSEYLFVGNKVYIFSLYPISNANMAIFEEMVGEFARKASER